MNVENVEWIDDCFRIEQKKWGTFDSYNKDEKCIVTSLTYDECLSATRWFLKFQKENKIGINSNV